MADIFVNSAAVGAANGTTKTDAYTTLAAAFAGALTKDDFIKVAHTHSESTAGVLTYGANAQDPETTPTEPLKIISMDFGSDVATAGAVVAATGTTNDVVFSDGHMYFYGITFKSQDDIFVGNTSNGIKVTFEECTLELTGVSSTDAIALGSLSTNLANEITLINSNLKFGNIAQGLSFTSSAVLFRWIGGAVSGPTYPDNLFEIVSRGVNAFVRGIDFSGMGSGKNLVLCDGVSSQHHWVHFEGCLLGASLTITNADPIHPGRVFASHCQVGTDADPVFAMHYRTSVGLVEIDAARYRDGGASDGERATPYSWSMTSNAGAFELYHPLYSPPICGWLDGDGSTAYTLRVYVASGGTLQDDEAWVEFLGQNDGATNSLYARKTTRPAPLVAPADLTTDGVSTYTGADVGTKQYVEVTYTPDKPGPFQLRVALAKPSERMTVDPLVYISPVVETNERAYLIPGLGFIHEGDLPAVAASGGSFALWE